MMKNSKLSKLLVAGVSVAMLASAVAPMAFADDEGSVESVKAPAFTVYIYADTNTGDFVSGAGEVESPGTGCWNKRIVKEFDQDSIDSNEKIQLNMFEAGDLYEIDGYYFDTNNDTWNDANAKADSNDVKLGSEVSVQELVTRVANDAGYASKSSANIVISMKKKDTLTLRYDYNGGNNYDYVEYGVFAADSKTPTVGGTGTETVVVGSDIAMPRITVKSNVNKYFAGCKVSFQNSGSSTTTIVYGKDNKDYYTGATLNLSTIDGLKKDATVTIEPVIADIEKVTLTLNASVENDDIKRVLADSTISGVTYEDRDILAKYTSAKDVYYGNTVDLPVLTTSVDGWTFSHWAVDAASAAKKADGETNAKGTVISGSFDPTAFAANADIVLRPVFVKGSTPDPVITYSAAKTPNDTIKKYVDGKYEKDVLVSDVLKFQGGLFYNEVDEIFEYYLNKNSAGKFVVDTTVNGLVDGIVFDKGVQDTEAYGLYKVSDSDPFFYLVSDGVYQSDYNGMWEDEDGSVYKLEKGCTNTTFTGVYDRGDWALSVKDSKVQKDETGFVLYGEDQYWFINGICNMKETEAVREHTDGNFYYTVGAKIDFTFNGECNGHTFVNGVASK